MGNINRGKKNIRWSVYFDTNGLKHLFGRKMKQSYSSVSHFTFLCSLAYICQSPTVAVFPVQNLVITYSVL